MTNSLIMQSIAGLLLLFTIFKLWKKIYHFAFEYIASFFLILCLTHAMFVLHIWWINFSIYILDKIIIIIFNNTFIHCTFITTTNHFFNYCLVTLMIANERSNIHIQFAYYLKIWKLSFSNDFPIHHKFLFKQEMKDISI